MPKLAERPVVTPDSQLTAAQYLAVAIDKSGKSQTEIASELGYPNPNIITMFKQGRTKIPVPRVPEIAKVLETDPIHLMRVVMNEYQPEVWKVLEATLGKSLVSESEMKVVNLIREEAGSLDVAPETDAEKAELRGLVKAWKGRDQKVIRHH